MTAPARRSDAANPPLASRTKNDHDRWQEAVQIRREWLAHGFHLPVRAALASEGPLPVCWYGQQDASWVAYYDVLHRLGLARYGPDETVHLADWAALVRSCGWWWPGEEVCVVVERPATVRTEPVPGTCHKEVRLRHDGVKYRDGWQPLLR